jgi:hypothetical protein
MSVTVFCGQHGAHEVADYDGTQATIDGERYRIPRDRTVSELAALACRGELKNISGA